MFPLKVVGSGDNRGKMLFRYAIMLFLPLEQSSIFSISDVQESLLIIYAG